MFPPTVLYLGDPATRPIPHLPSSPPYLPNYVPIPELQTPLVALRGLSAGAANFSTAEMYFLTVRKLGVRDPGVGRAGLSRGCSPGLSDDRFLRVLTWCSVRASLVSSYKNTSHAGFDLAMDRVFVPPTNTDRHTHTHFVC